MAERESDGGIVKEQEWKPLTKAVIDAQESLSKDSPFTAFSNIDAYHDWVISSIGYLSQDTRNWRALMEQLASPVDGECLWCGVAWPNINGTVEHRDGCLIAEARRLLELSK